jgi:hypothetical protein
MRSDHLWFCYVPTPGSYGNLNRYDVNEVNIECKAYKTHHSNVNEVNIEVNSVIKRCGVHVECMCCPHQRLGDTQHPFFPIRLNPGDSMGTLGYHISSGATKYQPPLKFLDLPDLGFDLTVSERFDLGSSSMPNNDDSDLGFLHPFFPIRLNPGNSMGTLGYDISSGATNDDSDFNLGSSSMPNNDDSDLGFLHPFFATSYASHSNSIETTNNEFDSTLKGFHGDGCDLSLLPHAYPMGSQDYQPPTVHISLPSSEGLDLPALAFGSTVSEGFDLGSSSMPHTDDSDFNLYPPSKKMRTS